MLRKRKFTSPKILPLTKDIQRLVVELKNVMKENFDKLKSNNTDGEAYSELIRALLAYLIMFNRRRSGETSKLEFGE